MSRTRAQSQVPVARGSPYLGLYYCQLFKSYISVSHIRWWCHLVFLATPWNLSACLLTGRFDQSPVGQKRKIGTFICRFEPKGTMMHLCWNEGITKFWKLSFCVWIMKIRNWKPLEDEIASPHCSLFTIANDHAPTPPPLRRDLHRCGAIYCWWRRSVHHIINKYTVSLRKTIPTLQDTALSTIWLWQRSALYESSSSSSSSSSYPSSLLSSSSSLLNLLKHAAFIIHVVHVL